MQPAFSRPSLTALPSAIQGSEVWVGIATPTFRPSVEAVPGAAESAAEPPNPQSAPQARGASVESRTTSEVGTTTGTTAAGSTTAPLTVEIARAPREAKS